MWKKLNSLYVFGFLGILLILLSPTPNAYASQIGVVSGDYLNVRNAPAVTNSTVLGQLMTGNKIEIIAQKGEWYQFEFQGKTGFVHKDFVNVDSSHRKVSIFVNGEKLETDVDPQIVNGRTFIPFRHIAEALAIEVKWLNDTRQVYALDKDTEVIFTIGSSNVNVNGTKTKISSPPFIDNSRTLLPLRFFAETFGADVGWNGDTYTVTVKREIDTTPPTETAEQNEDAAKEVEVEPTPPLPSEDILEEVVEPEPELEEKAAPKPTSDKETETGATVLKDGVKLYKEPIGTSPLATLRKGDKVEVLGFSNSDWAKVKVDGQIGYVYLDDGSLDALSIPHAATGIVTANELNVRSQPGTSGKVIGSFPKGKSVQVYEFSGNWAKVKINSKWGYVHSYYLKLGDDKSLAVPKVTNGVKRSVITWTKRGNVVSSHTLNGNGMIIATTANTIDRLTESHPGIKAIEYIETSDGMRIKIELNKGYHYVVRHSVNELTVTILASGLAGKKIVIDAGHGAHDPGAIGPTGLQEKTVNLSVALKLRDLLEKAGVNVIMTRSNDTFLSLAERVELTEKHQADAFVSIHADSFRSNTQGSTTFYHSGENASWQQSKVLSDIAISKLTANLQTVNRGSNNKSLHVIREAEIPAILVELAFLSNPIEEAMLKNDKMRQKAAEALYNTLLEFYN